MERGRNALKMLQKMDLVVFRPYLFWRFQKCLKNVSISLYSLGYESVPMCIWKRKIQGGSKDTLSIISSGAEAVLLSQPTLLFSKLHTVISFSLQCLIAALLSAFSNIHRSMGFQCM